MGATVGDNVMEGTAVVGLEVGAAELVGAAVGLIVILVGFWVEGGTGRVGVVGWDVVGAMVGVEVDGACVGAEVGADEVGESVPFAVGLDVVGPRVVGN